MNSENMPNYVDVSCHCLGSVRATYEDDEAAEDGVGDMRRRHVNLWRAVSASSGDI